ncbi:fungal-specific transcription factor domain-containing protein [Auriculariales sp. MPI-PUGE-AT-0066]|nr:fungal-specific transcription factor domain-containing protein [Auriculariales sp. MPI-PUGE-AT-0066]
MLLCRRSQRPRSARMAYIASLESRLQSVEALLHKHVPEALLMQELSTFAMYLRPLSAHRQGGEDAPGVTPPQLEPWDELVAQSLTNNGLTSSYNHQVPSHSAQIFPRRPEFWCTPDHEFRMERPEKRYLDPILPLQNDWHFSSKPTLTITTRISHFPPPVVRATTIGHGPARDQSFTVAVLLVCALGESRLSVGTGSTQQDQHSPGWSFFLQAEPFLRVPTPAEPQLLDIQSFFLATLYAAIVRGNPAAWTLFGAGTRLAYLANAHRRDRYMGRQPTLLDELWKRTFWAMVVLDRLSASFIGRPLIMKDESFDLDLPLDVDDASWDIDAPGWPLRDPPSVKPSSLSYFVCHIRMVLILGVSIRTIYSINRSQLLMGFVGSDWEQQITSKIDNMLEEWALSVPTHLRWDPNAADLTHFVQSSLLSVRYHAIRINVHNPFMRTTAHGLSDAAQSGRTLSGLTSSLIICTEAAVDCSEVLIAVMERFPRC